MIIEEIEHIEHVFKAVAIITGEDMCDEAELEITQSFERRIATDLQETFAAYKDDYEDETQQFDVDEADLLQDFITESAIEKGLDRLKSYAQLYYLLRASQQHGYACEIDNDRILKLKIDILDDIELYINSYLIMEGENSYCEDAQKFDLDEDSWDMINNVRRIISCADTVSIKKHEIDFLFLNRLETALEKTRIDMEFNTAVTTCLPTQDDLAFKNCRSSCSDFYKLIAPCLQQQVEKDNASLTPKFH